MKPNPASQNRKSNFDPTAAAGVLERATTRSGARLLELSNAHPVLLVFLRHAGCTFCREMLADLSENRREIEACGVRIVLVHMGSSESLDELVERNGLLGLDRIHDESQELYRAFGLKGGSLRQLFGLDVLKRALVDGVLLRHGIGKLAGDSSQMPGFFLIHEGRIVKRFRHKTVADRPDYSTFVLDETVAEAVPQPVLARR